MNARTSPANPDRAALAAAYDARGEYDAALDVAREALAAARRQRGGGGAYATYCDALAAYAVAAARLDAAREALDAVRKS